MDKKEEILNCLNKLTQLLGEANIQNKSEQELVADWKNNCKRLSKEHEAHVAILNNLLLYFQNFTFLDNVQIIGDRLQFRMPGYKEEWLNSWKSESKAIQTGKLSVFLYNIDRDYIVEIQ